MLEDLTGRVDDTDSRLRKVQRTMNDFIRRNEGA
jgi:syntaxin 6